MISQRTKERILDTARIEEVVGDFVKLRKKSGAYMMGLCPFHNEKTPSFTVTPDKGIYKCFGCGKAGDSIGFIMEHEKASYPEALRYLANKYHIEIEEDQTPEENLEVKNERESLFVVSSFAQKYFTESLLQTDEGKGVGLKYFRDRGFTDETIHTFQLGYSPEQKDAFSKGATSEGHQEEYLVKSGLSIRSEYQNGENTKVNLIDRFRGRVMFPIHNISGRVCGFGGRILNSEIKTAKYLNSPDSEIYHKSQILYGIFFAKKEIVSQDNCFLVEGYTDVISLHQSGVKNVVASSGTSLTTDQIRLISRFTRNITVLYDGDAAGIKASLRGIDMILEEGMHVRVVLFPDGDDPDSYARKHSPVELREFIDKQAQDFIMFKAGLLMKDAGNDPVKKAALIRDIVESIAKVPDPILRSEYIKECSARLDTNEQVLISETNKVIRRLQQRIREKPEEPAGDIEELLTETLGTDKEGEKPGAYHQERDIIRILLNYGHLDIVFEDLSDPKFPKEVPVKISSFILNDLESDGIVFEYPMYAEFYKEYVENIHPMITDEHLQEDNENGNASKEERTKQSHFINHENTELSGLAIDLISSPHTLSENWKKAHRINVLTEKDLLKQAVLTSLYSLKIRKVQILMDDLLTQIRDTSEEALLDELMQKKQKLDAVRSELAKISGTVVLR